MTPEDQQLATAIQSGDADAFERLFRRWYAPLVGFARRFVADPAESEEIVQDLFCQLWDRRDQFAPTTSLRSYLFTAIRNRCFNHLQHLKVRREQEAGISQRLQEQGHVASPTSQLEGEELRIRIDRAVAELPPRCREVFEASRYEGKKYKEIAEELGISARTVEVQIGKALKHLRKVLRDVLPLIVSWLMMGGGE